MSWQIVRGGGAPGNVVVGILTSAAGAWRLALAGQVQTLDVPDASDYRGITFATFAGVPDGDYTLSATSLGGAGETRTAPVRVTSGAHKTLIGSCFATYSWWDVIGGAMQAEAAEQVILGGDNPYIDSIRQVTAAVDKPTAIRKEYWKWFAHPSRADLLAGAAVFALGSDHKYPGNDVPGRDDIGDFAGSDAWNRFNLEDPELYPRCIGTTGAQGLADSLTLKGICLDTFAAFYPWLPNPDAGTVYAGSPLPAYTPYTRWRVGRVEYFLLDQTSFCDYITQSGVTNRSMLGSDGQQLAWLLDRLRRSAAPFKAVIAEQQILKESPVATTGRNDYGRRCFRDEGDVLKAALTDFTGWTVPGGASIWSGDVHTPSVLRYTPGQSVWQITPCPSGTGGVPQLVNTATDTELRWQEFYAASNVPRRYYGKIVDTGSGPLQMSICDQDGNTCWYGEQAAGANEVSYPRPRVGA